MTTNIEQERIDFEVWYIPKYEESCESKTCYGRYMGIAWKAWQAALKLERDRHASKHLEQMLKMPVVLNDKK